MPLEIWTQEQIDEHTRIVKGTAIDSLLLEPDHTEIKRIVEQVWKSAQETAWHEERLAQYFWGQQADQEERAMPPLLRDMKKVYEGSEGRELTPVQKKLKQLWHKNASEFIEQMNALERTWRASLARKDQLQQAIDRALKRDSLSRTGVSEGVVEDLATPKCLELAEKLLLEHREKHKVDKI